MNRHDPKEVIETMVRITNDEMVIDIRVENETIIFSDATMGDNFSMRWSYPGYGNERVREISKSYHKELARVQKEMNDAIASVTDES